MLTVKTRKIVEVALANRVAAKELSDAVDAGAPVEAVNVAEIADPGTATAEDVANKVNELIQALIAAGLMAP
jgi:hypothetical protein